MSRFCERLRGSGTTTCNYNCQTDLIGFGVQLRAVVQLCSLSRPGPDPLSPMAS